MTHEDFARQVALEWARVAASLPENHNPQTFGKNAAMVLRTVMQNGPSGPAVVDAPGLMPAPTEAPGKSTQKNGAERAGTSKKDATPSATVAAEEPKTASTGDAADTGDAEAPKATTYEEVAQAFLKVAKSDKPKAMAALQKFGVSRPPELKPEQYADFIAEVTK